MKIKCHGCKKAAAAKVRASANVGEITKKTGFTWVPTATDMSVFFCPGCAAKLKKLVQGIHDLAGEFYSYPPTTLELLSKKA